MHDDPAGAALLDAARRALLDEVAPALAGRSRFVALMVANAMGIVSRELDAAARLAEARAAALTHAAGGSGAAPEVAADQMVAAIRAGAHDADPALHRDLLAASAVAAEIWRPAVASGPPAAALTPD